MKWPPSNLKEALFPIMFLNTLAGLTVIEYPLGKRRPVLTFFYILGCVSFYFLVLKFGSYYTEVTVFSEPTLNGSLEGIEKILAAALTYINIFVTASCLIICWHRNKDLLLLIRRINLMDDSLTYLGYKRDYRKLFFISLLRVILWLFIVCFLILTDIVWLSDFMTVYPLMYCIFISQFPLHLNAVIDLTFTIAVESLIAKLKVVNALLLAASGTYSPLKVNGYEIRNRKLAGIEESINDCLFFIGRKSLIQILRLLHLEINNVARDLNSIFGVQITLEMAAHLAILTGSLYNFYMIIITQMEMVIKIKTVFRIFVWCTIYLIRFFRVSSTCATISDEARKTGEVLINLNISIPKNVEIKEEMKIFFLQLLQRPLYFTTCGSANIDYTFVRKFIGSVTTYLVILIQMHPQNVTN